MFQVGDIIVYTDGIDPDHYHYLVTEITRKNGIKMICLETGSDCWDTYNAMDCYTVYA
jgi:hypothetical protein